MKRPPRWQKRFKRYLERGIPPDKLQSLILDEDPPLDLDDDAPHKLREVAKRYSESIEHKSLAPDGSRCTGKTKGLLRRRPIRASGVFQFIGKEVDRGTSADPEYLPDDPKLMRYGTTGQRFPWNSTKLFRSKAREINRIIKSNNSERQEQLANSSENSAETLMVCSATKEKLVGFWRNQKDHSQSETSSSRG